MTELKFSNDLKWREFEGKQYLNCDGYSDAEMEVVANWDSATKEQRAAFCEKYGFKSTPGLFTRRAPIDIYVYVRLADAVRTREWRTVKAGSFDEAIKVAEQMPDVEVCLEASITPGGV